MVRAWFYLVRGAMSGQSKSATVAMPPHRPIVLISLFDGIGGAREALACLRLPITHTYTAEIDEIACFVCRDAHQRRRTASASSGSSTKPEGHTVLGEGNVKKITVKDLTDLVNRHPGALFIVIAGSPCQDMSVANTDRVGLLGKKSRLFFVLVNILSKLQQLVQERETSNLAFIVENVASMEDAMKDTFSRYLGGVKPMRMKGTEFSPMRRPRYMWTNIGRAHPESRTHTLPGKTVVGQVKEVNRKCRPWNTSRDESCCITMPDSYLQPGRCLPKDAAGSVFSTLTCSEWRGSDVAGGQEGTCVLDEADQKQSLVGAEMCRLLRFPEDHLACLSEKEGMQVMKGRSVSRESRRLMGNTFMVQQIVYILLPISQAVQADAGGTFHLSSHHISSALTTAETHQAVDAGDSKSGQIGERILNLLNSWEDLIFGCGRKLTPWVLGGQKRPAELSRSHCTTTANSHRKKRAKVHKKSRATKKNEEASTNTKTIGSFFGAA